MLNEQFSARLAHSQSSSAKVVLWKQSIGLQSLLVDVNHAESSCLVGLALVIDSEEHHFVAGEAVALLLRHFQYQRD